MFLYASVIGTGFPLASKYWVQFLSKKSGAPFEKTWVFCLNLRTELIVLVSDEKGTILTILSLLVFLRAL